MMGKLDHIAIEEMLSTHFIGRIGCHVQHTTYIVPISYAYTGGAVYGHSLEGLKLNMMRQNPELCFEVDHLENMANWKSVIAWGLFEELTSEQERKIAAGILMQRALPLMTSATVKITPHWPFDSFESKQLKGILFRIRLNKKTGRFEKPDSDYFYAT